MTVRWEMDDVNKVLNKPARSKYGAKKVQIDGIGFDSKREGARYVELKTMQQAGLIQKLELHPTFQIWLKGIFICDVELDFSYFDGKQEIYEDVKSTPTNTSLSKLKRRLVEAQYGIAVELLK